MKLSNEDYHAQNTHLSSSTLKQVMKDPKGFVKFWVHGIREKNESSAMLEGSLVHCMLLEPAKVQQEYAFFEGLRRAGAAYESFAAQNTGKTIIGAPMHQRSLAAVAACKRLPVLLELLQGGEAEATLMAEFMGVPVKIRADYINVDKGYIVDLKTTSYPADIDTFRQTIEHYDYDLSAALYKKVAQEVYKKPFEYYWAPVSKVDLRADVYKMGVETYQKGLDKLMLAVMMFKRLQTNNFVIDVKSDIINSEDYEVLSI